MSRPLQVGVQLPEVERRVEWPELLTMARTAEEVGLDSLWLGDHLLYDLPGGLTRGPWEVWTSLAAVAAVTSRVEIGPFVASTAFHAPAMLAKMAATVDGISGGRLVLGLGAGWNEREYTAYGFPFDERVTRFEEAFTVIRTLLREGRIDHHGRFHELTDCVLDPGPTRPGGPPLMLGSTGPRMLRIGLPHVDLWNTWWSDYANSPAEFARLKARVDAAVSAAGRTDPVGATAAVLVQLAGGAGRVMGDSGYAASVTPVSGGPGALAEHLHAMAEAGAEHVQLVLDPITTESISAIGRALAVLDG
ncbi:LLM class flavin-dependent oxidoreductase [Intrasporangium sp. YIM S08009]|uniref:LLM class flavin-dependent oxidoreductase n=1 Tax=Intrasporangium zincisolvens TaxID=3080018 RepID=UPI002B056A9B|nr:LLM class flavin-dependent oxidoreductase [Intrasporangium sp. YIM S08009]